MMFLFKNPGVEVRNAFGSLLVIVLINSTIKSTTGFPVTDGEFIASIT